jgi:hypothetical protein
MAYTVYTTTITLCTGEIIKRQGVQANPLFQFGCVRLANDKPGYGKEPCNYTWYPYENVLKINVKETIVEHIPGSDRTAEDGTPTAA